MPTIVTGQIQMTELDIKSWANDKYVYCNYDLARSVKIHATYSSESKSIESFVVITKNSYGDIISMEEYQVMFYEKYGNWPIKKTYYLKEEGSSTPITLTFLYPGGIEYGRISYTNVNSLIGCFRRR